MMGTRQRSGKKNREPAEKEGKKQPEMPALLEERNYSGVYTLMEFDLAEAIKAEDKTKRILCLKWMAFCKFHLGDYAKAVMKYDDILALGISEEDVTEIQLFKACAMFYNGLFEEAQELAVKQNAHPLRQRLLFHISQRLNDEDQLREYHKQLTSDSIEDQLSLASMHFLRSHFQEAIDVYKHILLEHRTYIALNVYIALCYYKLDYYDVSQEVLDVYLRAHPKSPVALNLKACNHFRNYTPKEAEQVLKQIGDNTSLGRALTAHNSVVFRAGEGAQSSLPSLLDVIPEARLNLVIYYLRSNEVQEAYELIEDIKPNTAADFTLLAVVNAAYGQLKNSKELKKRAQQYFQIVGASPAECDTIPGRQCMASCFFLLGQFEDVLIYLDSIKTYFFNNDDFNWNLGVAKCKLGQWKEGEEALLNVSGKKENGGHGYKSEYCYVSWLARAHIMNGKASEAWALYMSKDLEANDSFSLAQLIANDCYRTGQFYYAAKAFDMLEKVDPRENEFWEGKRGACVGVLRQVLAGQEQDVGVLDDMIALLRNSPTNEPTDQVEAIVAAMEDYLAEH